MKSIAKSLGMAPPNIDYGVSDGEVISGSATDVSIPDPHNVPALDETYEDTRIIQADQTLDSLVREGMAAVRETFERATDLAPRDQARMREVGAQLMKATLDVLAQKQKSAFTGKDFKRKKGVLSGPQTVSNTVINNIHTSREKIMEMLDNDEL